MANSATSNHGFKPEFFPTEIKGTKPGLLEDAERLFYFLSEISDEADHSRAVLFGEGESNTDLHKGPSIDSVLAGCFDQAKRIRCNLESINSRLSNK